jgi:hypothetical protein
VFSGHYDLGVGSPAEGGNMMQLILFYNCDDAAEQQYVIMLAKYFKN